MTPDNNIGIGVIRDVLIEDVLSSNVTVDVRGNVIKMSVNHGENTAAINVEVTEKFMDMWMSNGIDQFGKISDTLMDLMNEWNDDLQKSLKEFQETYNIYK